MKMWQLLIASRKFFGILIFCAANLKFLSAVYYYCPDACVCDIKKAAVKCNPNIHSNSIPPGIASKTILLSMENYNFSTLNTTRLSGLQRLRDLRLRRNGIVKISKKNFAILNGLSSLDLSWNKIQELDDFAFASLTRLRNLDLSNNLIIALGMSLQKLTKLVQLNVGFNHLTQLNPKNFLNCRELKYIYAEKNHITKIESTTFIRQVKLTKLKLKSNQLGQGGSNMTFQRYLSGKLRSIDLSDNQLSAVPEHLPIGLQELRLSFNSLTQPSEKEFEDFYRLEFLYLQNNNISRIEDSTFKYMPRIKKIWLNSNALTSIPRRLPANLTDLYLQDNNIGIQVTAENFSGLYTLSRLHLQNNAIESITPGAFESLGKTLETLMLHNNQLKNLRNNTFLGLGDLNLLSLSRNPLRLIESDCFNGLNNLKVLRLSHIDGINRETADDVHSPIEADDYDVEEPEDFTQLSQNIIANVTIFGNIPNLEILTLTNSSAIVQTFLRMNNSSHIIFDHLVELEIVDNGLEYIPSNFMDFFPNCIELNLSANIWKCDSLILPLLNMLNNPTLEIKDKDKLQCNSPEQLFGRALINLTVDEIEELESPTIESTDIPFDGNSVEISTDSYMENNGSLISGITSSSEIPITTTTYRYEETTLKYTANFKFSVNFQRKHIIWIISISSTFFFIAIAVLSFYLVRLKCGHKMRLVDSYARFKNSDNVSLMSEDNEEMAKDKKLICYFKRGSSNIQILNSFKDSQYQPNSLDKYVAESLAKQVQGPGEEYYNSASNHLQTRTLVS